MRIAAYQLALMVMLVLIGFALNWVTFQWMKHPAPIIPMGVKP
jgi:hypothetical protein